MPLTHIDSADFMKLLGVAVKKFSPYNVNFPVRWANNPKYSQKLLLHIYVCVRLLIYCDVHICICVFEYLYFSKSASTWMHPPWVSIAQSQPSSQERLFFLLLGAHFSTQDSSRKWMRIAAKVQKCTNTQTQIQKYTDANIQIHKCKYISRPTNEWELPPKHKGALQWRFAAFLGNWVADSALLLFSVVQNRKKWCSCVGE